MTAIQLSWLGFGGCNSLLVFALTLSFRICECDSLLTNLVKFLAPRRLLVRMCVLEIVLDDGDEFGRSTVSLEMASYQLQIGHFVLRSFRARSCSARIVSSSATSRYSRSLATMKSESRPISLAWKFLRLGSMISQTRSAQLPSSGRRVSTWRRFSWARCMMRFGTVICVADLNFAHRIN